MRRVTNRKVLLKKNKEAVKSRIITPAVQISGSSSVFEEIKRRGGVARVCVIRAVGGIGDVLMTTPALMHLKKEFPQIHLTYAVDRHTTATDVYYKLVQNAPFIDEIIDARYVQRNTYDALVDISAVCIRYERKGLPSINRIDLFARACGILHLRKKLPFYQVEPSEKLWAQMQMSNYKKNGKTIVILHTASFEGKRSWIPGYYLDLIGYASKRAPDIQFFIFDFNKVLGSLDRFTNCTDFSEEDIRNKAALIAEADLFIGPDSGPMHLAGALKTKSIVIFGSVPPEARINYYSNHSAVRLIGLSCLGCWYEACPIRFKCMTGVTALMVYNEMMYRLGES